MPDTAEEATPENESSLRDRIDCPEWFRRASSIKVDLGIAVGEAMRKKGITSEEVADQLNKMSRLAGENFSRLYVEKLRSANAFPRIKTIARLEQILDTELISVLFDPNSSNQNPE